MNARICLFVAGLLVFGLAVMIEECTAFVHGGPTGKPLGSKHFQWARLDLTLNFDL